MDIGDSKMPQLVFLHILRLQEPLPFRMIPRRTFIKRKRQNRSFSGFTSIIRVDETDRFPVLDRPTEDQQNIHAYSTAAMRRTLVEPGWPNGIPAVRTMRSPFLARPFWAARRVACSTVSEKLLTTGTRTGMTP